MLKFPAFLTGNPKLTSASACSNLDYVYSSETAANNFYLNDI